MIPASFRYLYFRLYQHYESAGDWARGKFVDGIMFPLLFVCFLDAGIAIAAGLRAAGTGPLLGVPRQIVIGSVVTLALVWNVYWERRGRKRFIARILSEFGDGRQRPTLVALVVGASLPVAILICLIVGITIAHR